MQLEIRVSATRELFYNSEDAYGIYGASVNEEDLVNPEFEIKLNKYGNISIKGSMPRLDLNEEWIVKLSVDKNSQYEGSYIVDSIRRDKPVTVEQQKDFLKSILTVKQIENIFEVYKEGQDILGMIESGEFDYSLVKNLGEKTFEKLRDKVLSNLEMSEILIFLSKYGIKYNMIKKLIKEYKSPQIVIQKIEQNPYLLTEIKGIGFLKADAIAKAVGYDMLSPHRITSCIHYAIREENKNGHSWVGDKQLLNRCIALLAISKDNIKEVLNSNPKGIMNLDGRFTRDDIYLAEQGIAMKMIQFKLQSKKTFETECINVFLDDYCAKNNVSLEEKQRQFFHDWNENNISLLIGSGGMGKSWLIRILLELIKKKSLTTILLSPTGKASKILANYANHPAQTIHRAIGVYDDDEGAVKYIHEDVIIVDESSMCDVFILDKLFKAIQNNNSKILFVGDDFQLPSVGVGSFLYDSIRSGVIKISQLQKVFRQEKGGILNVATDIRNGVVFLNNNETGRKRIGNDCLFHLVNQNYIRDGYIHYYKKLLEKFSSDDIVLLTPTNKGKLGTVEMNKTIQSIVNPENSLKKEKKFGKKENEITYRVGDLVMNTSNTYGVKTINGGEADLFNGDNGKIVDIDTEEKCLVIDYEGIVVRLDWEIVLTTLMHSWAMTIHKCQGSQYKVVIAITDRSASYQLNANLIYTGVSRATKYLIVLGQAETINDSIKKFANMERRSFLYELLNKFNSVEDNKKINVKTS